MLCDTEICFQVLCINGLLSSSIERNRHVVLDTRISGLFVKGRKSISVKSKQSSDTRDTVVIDV